MYCCKSSQVELSELQTRLNFFELTPSEQSSSSKIDSRVESTHSTSRPGCPVDQKMFTETFWSKTAWTGGRKVEGPKKFAFSAHLICISFINDVIRKVCGRSLADAEFGQFVQSRTRNSGYVRTTHRQATSRSKRQRFLETNDDDASLDSNENNNATKPNAK